MSESLEYTKSWLSEEDFPHLGFSRNWESAVDFPTYEPNEMQVRKDMQCLHDETKNYINEKLIPEILAADATEAARTAAEEARAAAEGSRSTGEQSRVEHEDERIDAETARIAAENIRIENEATRVENEAERVDAEDIRKSNEAQRIINENAREDLETGYVARAEAAAKRAEDAAADAENTVGGDYVTQEELDAAIGAIPTPDVYTKTETLTNDTKAMFGLGGGAVPNDVLGVLSKATLVQSVPKFTKHTVANPAYGKSVGDTVSLNVSGVATDFIVVHKGKPSNLYDDSCNGYWLLMKDIYDTQKWTTGSYGNDYKNATHRTYLGGTFASLLDKDITNIVKEAKIPYTDSGTSGIIYSGANGIQSKVFLLSACEVGLNSSVTNTIYEDSAKLDYFALGDAEGGEARTKRIAYYGSSASGWWLRSPYRGNSANVHYVNYVGGHASTNGSTMTNGIRPALILPLDQEGAYYTDDSGNIYNEQEYTTVLTNVLNEEISVGAKIATGSYKGTGTYGASNPNTLTFDFVPRIVIVTQNDNNSLAPSGVGTWGGGFMWTYGAISVKCGDNSNYELVTELNGTTLTWYSENNSYTQQNSNYTYNYIAIG